MTLKVWVSYSVIFLFTDEETNQFNYNEDYLYITYEGENLELDDLKKPAEVMMKHTVKSMFPDKTVKFIDINIDTIEPEDE